MDFLAVGKVLKPQGVKGELKVEPLTRSPERFLELEKVFSDARGNKELKICGVRFQKNLVFLKIEGIDSIEGAEQLRNKLLFIPASWRKELPRGEYYIYELIGIEVFTGNGERLGTLKEVMSLPGNDVFLVEKEDEEILIPALKKVVKKVDLDRGQMEVELLPGLREAGANEN